MKHASRIGLLVGIFILVLGPLTGEGQESQQREGGRIPSATGFGFKLNRSPIEITSDTVEGKQKDQTVTFKGNVVAKQQDISIHADLLVVHYDPDNKRLKRVEAIGGVRVVQMDRRATSKKAIFYQDENKVVLDGDAVIREGDNVIRGERVTYYIDEERSVIEGGKGGRVSTTISPPKKE
jgi:lipopolysaccharide export system protein LptA